MTETDIQNKIRCELSAYGIVVRMNTGVFFTKDGRPVKCGIPGTPDLLFIGPDGRTAWIEVKTEKGRPSPEQKRFLKMLTDTGHRAGIARSTEEALKIIGGIPCTETEQT